MKVQIKPLDVKSWHNKSGKESFTQAKTIRVLYDAEQGGYATGLTKEEEEKYSKLLGGVDLSNTFVPEQPHPYWDTNAAKIKLENHTMILDTDRARDFIIWKNLRASKFVANSLREHADGLFPFATHYIASEEEDIEEKAKRIDMISEATLKLQKMTIEDKRNFVILLAEPGDTINLRKKSEGFIKVKLDELIKEKPEKFLEYISGKREYVTLQANVTELLEKGILTRENGAVNYKGEMIGFNLDEAVQWFLNGTNPNLKTRILEQLNS